MEKYPAAEAFVETLNANGVDNIFFNPGVDTVPVQVAIAKLNARGKPAPRLVVCLDESVAMSAAHGHYVISGRPQLVMVHSELGTMQVGGALHNAQWGRVPVILWAGNLQPPQRETWLKQPYDQGSIIRNCVKLERHVKAGEDIRDVLGEVFQAALTEPRGPVYLSYPLNALSGEVERKDITPAAGASSAAVINNDQMKEIAGILIEAENPLVLTGYAGRYAESVPLLVELAETLRAPVMSGPTRVNYPTTHPLSAGFEQAGGRGGTNPFKENIDV
ncbi:MAG: thiamine pyrophosphate-binding protein, partial [Dehalococcoidales bacterium]